MKKLIALLLVVCMVACLFVGCAGDEKKDDPSTAPTTESTPPETLPTEPPTTSDGADEKEPVTITFWQAGGDTLGASSIMRLLLDKFEMMYPWITVEYQAIPWSNDPHAQFQTAIAANECADVLVLGSPLDFQLAGEGALMPLDDLLTEEVKADLSDVLKNECVYKGTENPEMTGKMMSLPLYGGTRAVLYNKEIFDFFNVPYPTEQMTHAELLEMAKKLTGEMNGKQVYGYGTRATDSAQYIHFMWNYGAEMIDVSTMTAVTDSEAWRKGTEDYLKFYEEGVTPEGSVAMDATTQLQLFVNGEIAMFVSAVDYALSIVKEPVEEGQTPWSEKLGVAALAGETYATSYCGADVLAVNGATQHVEEAALLLNYLMGTEAQAIYCKNVGFFPGVKSAASDPYFANDPIQAGYAATMEGAHYYGNYGVSTGTLLRANMQMLLNGEVTMEEYQANLTAEIQAAIEEAFG